mmetsp:Transcript_33712/g.88622  ORF Transcript_33712/g.88622 Transcript_33712/m.88622 type:complete len:147 (-) Transcript_33712:1240-1680(-)
MGSDRSLGASMYGLRMLAGGVAGVIAKTTLAPLDRIRIMAQTGASSVGMFATINVVVKQDGVVGLWSGNTINCLRIFPNKALLYMFQDSYKDFFKANLGQGYGCWRSIGKMVSSGCRTLTGTVVAGNFRFSQIFLGVGWLACQPMS